MIKHIKNIKHVVLALAILGSTYSCSGFLDQDTPSVVTEEYYNTKAGQEKLITSLYFHYRNVFNTGAVQYYGTDIYMGITSSETEKMFDGYDKSFNSQAPVVQGYWTALYKVVQEANILLNRCTPEIAGADYDKMIAEATFLRAMAYYYLVETFGDVPLEVEENTGIITEATRTAEATIYQFMIDELENVKGKLSKTTSAPGKLTDGAVRNLLGKLYLTRAYKTYADSKDFEKAAECFDEVIGNGSYSIIDDYAKVYSEDNQNNSEVIWAIQYGTDKNYVGGGNPQQKMFGFNITALEPEMFTRIQADYSSMGREYWINPKTHELFTDPIIDTRYDATFMRHFYINNPSHVNVGSLGIYFPRWNDNSEISEGAVKFYPFKSEDTYAWYPQSTSLSILEMGLDRMPIIKKFKDTKIEWGGAGSREDVIFRLSDTYLLAAEAYLGLNDEPTALERINVIRKRAAIDDNAYENNMKLSTIDLDVILDERARELLGEHDRWFDLKRTGKLIERAKAYNPFVSHYDNINPNYLVRPIPQDERNKVKGLGQNEGYN